MKPLLILTVSLALPAPAGEGTQAAGGGAGRPAGRSDVVRALGVAGREWQEGRRYSSPDGRFAALVVGYWLPVKVVHVVPAGSNRGVVDAHDATGFLWLPETPHTLLVSTSSVYGRAQILRWDGTGSWRHVVQGHNPATDHFYLVDYQPATRLLRYVHQRYRRSGTLVFERRRTIRLAKPPAARGRR
jgi:hypothetical protein